MRKNPGRKERRKQERADRIQAKYNASLGKEHKERLERQMKGIPKKDGSGKGKRLNRGRGGCATTRKTGQGRNR